MPNNTKLIILKNIRPNRLKCSLLESVKMASFVQLEGKLGIVVNAFINTCSASSDMMLVLKWCSIDASFN